MLCELFQDAEGILLGKEVYDWGCILYINPGFKLSGLGLGIMNCLSYILNQKQHFSNFFMNHKKPKCSKGQLLKIVFYFLSSFYF